MQNQPITRNLNLNTISEVCQRNDISYLGIFGSFNRKDFTAESDVDFLARFSKKKSLLDMVRIQREFSDQLGKPVDLVTENSISPYIKSRIKTQLQTIYERKR